MEYKHCKGKDLNIVQIEQLKEVWMECFHDTKEYLDMFLGTLLAHAELFYAKDSEKIIATAYALPLNKSDSKCCYYIYACAVLPDYRGKHIFHEICENIKASIKSPIYVYSIPKLKEWYASFIFPTYYTCNELVFSKTKSNHPLTLSDVAFDVDKFNELRQTFIASLTSEYIIYPDWFIKLLKLDKTYCQNVFDLLSDETDEFYLIGAYDDDILLIEETNIPSDKLWQYASALFLKYNVTTIKIKLPISDESDIGSTLVYAGQGTFSGNLWAPFMLL